MAKSNDSSIGKIISCPKYKMINIPIKQSNMAARLITKGYFAVLDMVFFCIKDS